MRQRSNGSASPSNAGDHRVVLGERRAQRRRRIAQLADAAADLLGDRIFHAALGVEIRRELGELVEARGRARRDRGGRGQHARRVRGQLHLGELARARRELARERAQLFRQLAARDRADRRPRAGASSGGVRRVGPPNSSSSRSNRSSGRSSVRKRLVGDARELVRLVGDHVREARVVGRPAQQQIVVRHHELRARERGAPAAERTRGLRGALLARAVLRARRDRAAAQIAQRREAREQCARQRADLAVRAQPRARRERGVGELVARVDPELAALREHLLRAPLAQVVRAALDREREQVGIAEHRRGRRDVVRESWSWSTFVRVETITGSRTPPAARSIANGIAAAR